MIIALAILSGIIFIALVFADDLDLEYGELIITPLVLAWTVLMVLTCATTI